MGGRGRRNARWEMSRGQVAVRKVASGLSTAGLRAEGVRPPLAPLPLCSLWGHRWQCHKGQALSRVTVHLVGHHSPLAVNRVFLK